MKKRLDDFFILAYGIRLVTMEQVHITLPDGSKRVYPKGITGQQIAEDIGDRLAKAALAITVNGEVWDLFRPIEHDATIKIHTWEDEEAKRTYWHSSAHLMAEAIEALFPGTKFGIGPPIENGFYYDIDMGDHSLTQADLGAIEKKMVELAKRERAAGRRRDAGPPVEQEGWG